MPVMPYQYNPGELVDDDLLGLAHLIVSLQQNVIHCHRFFDFSKNCRRCIAANGCVQIKKTAADQLQHQLRL